MGKHADLAGKIFGKLTAISLNEERKGSYWRCKCECGREKEVRADILKNGTTVTCGCMIGTSREFVDITGKKFASLTVLIVKDHVFCVARCDCGNEIEVRINNIKRLHTRSCGCLAKDNNLTHGVARNHPRIYGIWTNMMARCYKPTTKHYDNYGGRGIRVCERWHDPARFLEDMGATYASQLTLDRIDGDKGYSPENCRWATRQEQQNNLRTNRWIETPRGRLTVAQASREFGLRHEVIRSRLNMGWSDYDAVMTPINGKRTSS
ncbi:MAG TPA: hypothetical protein VIY48_06255 [Candidatus Paceibacterota bacterium]